MNKRICNKSRNSKSNFRKKLKSKARLQETTRRKKPGQQGYTSKSWNDSNQRWRKKITKFANCWRKKLNTREQFQSYNSNQYQARTKTKIVSYLAYSFNFQQEHFNQLIHQIVKNQLQLQNNSSDINKVNQQKLRNKQQMDIFFLCWSFDPRWLIKYKNPCRQLIFTIPMLVNITSLAWTFIQKSLHTDERLSFYLQVIILQTLLAISNLYMIVMIRMNSAEKLTHVKDNYLAIQQFYHDYQTKKLVWSKIGLIVTILTLSLSFIQRLFINYNITKYPCYANIFRYYVDLVFYTWIIGNILVFLLFKGVYLFFAWVCCPGIYLKVKKVID